MYSWFYNVADLIILQTPAMKEMFLKKIIGSENWNLKVMNNPIDRQYVIKMAKEPIPEKNLNPFIAVAGRFVYEKAYDILLSAFNRVLKERKDLNLVILGEGPKESEIRDLIKSLDMEKNVHLLGFKKNPFSYFKRAECCVISSRIEGFPNVLLQMMCVNENVVSTKCTDGIDQIEGIETCEIESINRLSTSILNSLSTDISIKKDKRTLFNDFLDNRSIKKYIDTIFRNIEEKKSGCAV
jgi:glycosyltransferase involved in cell wall biosynthesis